MIELALSDLFGIGLSVGGIDLEYRGQEGDEKFGLDYRMTAIGARASFSF